MYVCSPTNRLIVSLACLVCITCFVVTVQGQSPPIWDRSGMPTAQGAAGKNVSADKAEPAVTWERYSPGGEEFSALLPALPMRFSVSRPPKMFEKRKGGWLYTAYAEGTVYIVLSLDNPKRQESLEVFINEFQEYPIFRPNAAFERDVTLNGFKGKQYRVKAGMTRSIGGIVQFYLAKDHAYIFEVVSDKIDSPSVNRFLSSLTLDGKTKGQEITELPRMDASASTAKAPAPLSERGANQAVEQPKVLTTKEVTDKAVIVTKPQPGYTEEARKNQISGTVTLRAVLSSSGDVTDIRLMSNLPYGLTENAVAAARNMRFIPAVKDGSYVSQYVMIEYNFNLY
ncbi:MAG TPA: energy transducer TonB [Pyrinomonadaceae bacterium]